MWVYTLSMHTHMCVSTWPLSRHEHVDMGGCRVCAYARLRWYMCMKGGCVGATCVTVLGCLCVEGIGVYAYGCVFFLPMCVSRMGAHV